MAKKGYITGVGSRFDGFMTACDVVGMSEIPFVSQGADLISGVGSLVTGDFVGAGLSVAGLIPGVGQITGPAKMARRAAKIVDAAGDAKKTVGTAQQSARLLELTSKGGKADTVKSPSKPANRASEVDAKPAKKEAAKEKEDIDKKEADNVQEVDLNQDYNINPTSQKSNFDDLTPGDQWEILSNESFSKAVKYDNNPNTAVLNKVSDVKSNVSPTNIAKDSNIMSKPIGGNIRAVDEYNNYIANKNVIKGYKKSFN